MFLVFQTPDLLEKTTNKEPTLKPVLEIELPKTEEEISSGQNGKAVTNDQTVDRNENKEIEFDEVDFNFFNNDLDFSDLGSGQSKIEVEDFKTFLEDPYPRQNFDQFVDFKEF